jgi:hypothetical protein
MDTQKRKVISTVISAVILCGFLSVIVVAILPLIEVLPSAPLCFDISSYDYGASY